MKTGCVFDKNIQCMCDVRIALRANQSIYFQTALKSLTPWLVHPAFDSILGSH